MTLIGLLLQEVDPMSNYLCYSPKKPSWSNTHSSWTAIARFKELYSLSVGIFMWYVHFCNSSLDNPRSSLPKRIATLWDRASFTTLLPQSLASKVGQGILRSRARDCGNRVVNEARSHKVAILFGREDRGLSNEELQKCTYHMNIPTDSEYSSLNLAMAVQLLCVFDQDGFFGE
jgi:hypothetical protein